MLARAQVCSIIGYARIFFFISHIWNVLVGFYVVLLFYCLEVKFIQQIWTSCLCVNNTEIFGQYITLYLSQCFENN